MELGKRQTKSEGGEGVVTEERVSNFGDQSWEWTHGPSSGRDGGIVERRRHRPGVRHQPSGHQRQDGKQQRQRQKVAL
jgi:hypothetical protein